MGTQHSCAPGSKIHMLIAHCLLKFIEIGCEGTAD